MMIVAMQNGWFVKAGTKIATPADYWLGARSTVVLRVLNHVLSLPALVRIVRSAPTVRVRQSSLEDEVVSLGGGSLVARDGLLGDLVSSVRLSSTDTWQPSMPVPSWSSALLREDGPTTDRADTRG